VTLQFLAVRSAILATAWLLVSARQHMQSALYAIYRHIDCLSVCHIEVRLCAIWTVQSIPQFLPNKFHPEILTGSADRGVIKRGRCGECRTESRHI